MGGRDNGIIAPPCKAGHRLGVIEGNRSSSRAGKKARRLFLQSAQPDRKRSLGVRKEDLDSYSALSCLARRPQKCPNALYHFPTRRAGCARTEPKPKKTRFQDPTFLKLVAHTATVPFSGGSKNSHPGEENVLFSESKG